MNYSLEHRLRLQLLLIIPGFVTDVFGFLLLIPFSRKIIMVFISKNVNNRNKHNKTLDGEIIEDKKDDL